MNAAADSTLPASPRAMATPHPTHKFWLLLRREFWEHKGGFLWAPLVAGAISLLLTIMAIVIGEVAARKALADGEFDDEVMINGLDLGYLTEKLGPNELRELSQGIDIALYMASGWPLIVLGFVVFFYCLGALYDERKDRSVLFWKSLPVSDRDTVLSKAASALFVAPLIAIAAALATMAGFLMVLSVLVLAHGGDPYVLLWGPGNPLDIVASYAVSIPVYALWALPTVGWLLLCSAWSRSKPFLWAVMLPVFAGIFLSWFDLMPFLDLDSSWFWAHVVARVLLGTFPAMDLVYRDGFGQHDSPEGLLADLSAGSSLDSLAMPGLWIGAIAGAVMIMGAIRLRRWRDEG